MAKSQISTTVPPRIKQQFDDLCQIYGTGTAVLTVAIDRLYNAERPSDADLLRLGATNVKCANCDRPIDPRSIWQPGTYGEAYCPDCSTPKEEVNPMVRKLTPREIENFPGDASADVAILHLRNGIWYYGDSNPCEEDPTGMTTAQFIVDENNDYIPVAPYLRNEA